MNRAILLDIEGTTTSLSFVHDVLFPFARKHLDAFVQEHADDPAVRAQLDAVRRELGGQADNSAVLMTLHAWMDEDRKAPPLKALQGLIWKSGYVSGALKAQVYEDVPERMDAWRAAGLKVAIYSSGSVLAQKLLFAHTQRGDLTDKIDAYFDTQVGPKQESASYQHIAEALALPPSRITFASDAIEECRAAEAAGLTAHLIRRPDDHRPANRPTHPNLMF